MTDFELLEIGFNKEFQRSPVITQHTIKILIREIKRLSSEVKILIERNSK